MAEITMLDRSFFSLFGILLQLIICSGKLTCEKKGPCSCEMSDGSGTIDLKSLDKGKTPYFKNIQSDSTSYKFDFNPCNGMDDPYPDATGGTHCSSVSVCQHGTIGATSYSFDCGQPKPTMSVTEGGIVQFVYTSKPDGQTTRATTVNIVCDKDVDGKLSEFKEGPTAKFTTTLTTKYACLTGSGSASSISIGSILIIVFFSLLLVYFIAGILFMKFYKEAESVPEMIPNRSFWGSLPGLIKDGFLFFFHKIKSCCLFCYGKVSGSGYQEM